MTAVDRQREALELRKSGLSYDAIATRLKYAHASGAHKAVVSALKRTLQEPADDLRRIEVERLDAALAAIWHKVTAGDTWAIDRMLKIMERRAALLGLDAPKKVEQKVELGIREIATEVADEFGVPVEAVIAEAERIVRAGSRR